MAHESQQLNFVSCFPWHLKFSKREHIHTSKCCHPSGEQVYQHALAHVLSVFTQRRHSFRLEKEICSHSLTCKESTHNHLYRADKRTDKVIPRQKERHTREKLDPGILLWQDMNLLYRTWSFQAKDCSADRVPTKIGTHWSTEIAGLPAAAARLTKKREALIQGPRLYKSTGGRPLWTGQEARLRTVVSPGHMLPMGTMLIKPGATSSSSSHWAFFGT